MKKVQIILHFLLVFCLILSCSQKSEEVVIKPKQEYNPFLWRMQHFGKRAQMEPSFPVWFDDKIIEKKGISNITRRIKSLNNPQDTLDDELIEEHIYNFTNKGLLKSLSVKSFYDHLCFETVTVTYDFSKRETTGFCPIKSLIIEHFNKAQQTNDFKKYYSLEQTDQLEIYSLEDNLHELMFMKDSLYWGAISIDTMFHPEPEDVIVLGSPRIPHRKFQVENTVKYLNVVEYSYTNNGLMRSMKIENYPFITTRMVNYNLKGSTTGFVDSIFIDDKFLSKKEYKFKLKEDGLPFELNRWVEEDKKKIKIEQEIFSYEFFEKD